MRLLVSPHTVSPWARKMLEATSSFRFQLRALCLFLVLSGRIVNPEQNRCVVSWVTTLALWPLGLEGRESSNNKGIISLNEQKTMALPDRRGAPFAASFVGPGPSGADTRDNQSANPSTRSPPTRNNRLHEIRGLRIARLVFCSPWRSPSVLQDTSLYAGRVDFQLAVLTEKSGGLRSGQALGNGFSSSVPEQPSHLQVARKKTK
jgi:hypothetical protein